MVSIRRTVLYSLFYFTFKSNKLTNQLHLYQSPLRSCQREVPAIFYIRYIPTSTSYNKPWDGLTASKGYNLKRKFGVASKRLLGCACIFSRKNNGIWGGQRVGRVIKDGPAFVFLRLQCFYFKRQVVWLILLCCRRYQGTDNLVLSDPYLYNWHKIQNLHLWQVKARFDKSQILKVLSMYLYSELLFVVLLDADCLLHKCQVISTRNKK